MRKVVVPLALCLIVAGCGGRRGRPPVSSPDGSMALRTHIEQSRQDPTAYLCVVFEILDRSGQVLHSENTRASGTMRWTISWVSNDRIRLVSSDIGTYHWQRHANGTWAKEPPEPSPAEGTP